MMGFEHFIAMGGYARYVWSAYGLAMVVIFGNMIYTTRISKRTRKLLKRRYQRDNP